MVSDKEFNQLIIQVNKAFEGLEKRITALEKQGCAARTRKPRQTNNKKDLTNE